LAGELPNQVKATLHYGKKTLNPGRPWTGRTDFGTLRSFGQVPTGRFYHPEKPFPRNLLARKAL